MKISISLATAEQQVLDEVLASAPYANVHAIATLAVRLGLAVLKGEPGRIPALLSRQKVRFSQASQAATEPSGSSR